MNLNYMQRIRKDTPTRFWINNPTAAELEKSLESGAFAGTTNPAFGAALLKQEPAYMNAVIDTVMADVRDDSEAADRIYETISARFMQGFLPQFEKSGGTEGFVTMQDDPRRDGHPDLIVACARRHMKVGRNFMAKVPVIATGMDAMEQLIELGIPVCATESFSIAQFTAMCERYELVSRRCGKRPPFYITHITGIYDEELQHQVRERGICIAPDVLAQAGCIIARKQYHLLKQRGYHAVFLGGGARGTRHFTELVGGDLHVTMNWSTLQEMINADTAVISRIDAAAPDSVVQELREKIPDFRRAYDDDGLPVEAFEHFAPLLRFRKNFIDGCDHVLKAIAERRRTRPAR